MNGRIDSRILDIKRTQSVNEIEICVDSRTMSGGIKKWKKPCVFLCLFVLATSVIFFTYVCPRKHCFLWPGSRPLVHMIIPDSQTSMHNINNGSNIANQSLFLTVGKPHANSNHKLSDSDTNSERSFPLNFNEDVLVFLHIQKTGGTVFGRSLVKNLDLAVPCKCFTGRKRCDCYSKKHRIWIFSRYSTGWSCGLHADWTELKNCVPGFLDRKERIQRRRNYYYITLLRDPVARFISEWKHVERGATWRNVNLKCNGQSRSLAQVPFCYEGDDWSDVTLDEFMNCQSNLAINRQSRMLANLSLVNCYNHTGMTEQERDLAILESAKENLMNVTFFGLLEYMPDTQRLFENTFKLRFLENFVQYRVTHTMKAMVSDEEQERISKLNHIDVQLYEFAKKLFFKRVEKLNERLKRMKTNGDDTASTNTNLNPLKDYPGDEFKISDLTGPEDDYSEDDDDYEEDDESDEDDESKDNLDNPVNNEEGDSKIFDFNFKKTDDKTSQSGSIKEVIMDEKLVDATA